MKRTLYLHIGVHRTATTSIQRVLNLNAAALRDRGYLLAYGVARHFKLVNALYNRDLRVADAASELNAQAEAAEAVGQPIRALLISDEDICTRPDLDRLARLGEYFDLKVILVMRRQDLWIESWYRQNVKWQWNAELAHLTFDAFLSRRDQFGWIDYDRLTRHLIKRFGAAALIPLIYEPGQMADDPVATFCAAIGLADSAGLRHLPYALNASPSPLMCEFMRTLPLDEMPDRYRQKIEKACTKADWYVKRGSGPQSPYYMDAATRAKLLADYAPGNAAVAARHFGRADLFREPLPDAGVALAPRQLPADSYATIETFVAPMLRALISNMIEADAKD